MKRYFLYLLTAVLGILNIQPASAQQTQDALYIFRNDGAFNGFFYAVDLCLTFGLILGGV